MIRTRLLDLRNWEVEAPSLIEKIRGGKIIGFDIETEQSRRHAGLQAYNKLVFDTRRTVVTGFSIYVDGDDTAWYVNLAHADRENRVPWAKARTLLDAKPDDATWIIHNAPYELVMMKTSLGYDLQNFICSLQLCVSAYNDDEYPIERFFAAGLGEMAKLLGKVAKVFATFTPGQQMDQAQAEVFAQVVGKASNASHSYNGHVKTIRHGYGLKEAVERWFGYKMTTYEQVVGNRHMGELTAEEVTAYGADDAYWCVRLFHRVLQHMVSTNAKVVDTYLNQELPMVQVYADVWRHGLRVNKTAVEERRDTERAECAAVLRRLKTAINRLLPFPSEPHEGLMRDSWYATGAQRYRDRITTWAALPDSADDRTQCLQASGAVASGWSDEKGVGPNWTHYMPIRTLMYDLLEEKLILDKGKVQSDGEARGRMIDRLKKKLREADETETKYQFSEPETAYLYGQEACRLSAGIDALTCINELAGIEQRMKLYLTPYSHLIDPETERVYPVLSSMLNSRRMATSFPNPMQLAKRGESTYIRGFYEADDDEDLIVSLDWSQIELVLIGDMSGDPEFAKAYSQIPYEDLHTGATVDGLSVMIPEVTLDLFKQLDSLPEDQIPPAMLIKPNGEKMAPKAAKKYWRTEIGKGSNFNYWYSGALSTVGQKLGWSSEQMWEATERYRQRFAVAEQWRKETISFCQQYGYVELPDGHRRYRFEATLPWAMTMRNWFGVYNNDGIVRFGEEVIRSVQTRAKNQSVNSMIQGTCATLAKRSILRIIEGIKREKLWARFMLPIHDEVLFSVHRGDVIPFLRLAKRIMCDHPDIIKTLPVDCTASVGRTFEPWDEKKARFGQIELDEAPNILNLPVGKRLNEAQITTVVDYLMEAA